jgi:hypothetical protein
VAGGGDREELGHPFDGSEEDGLTDADGAHGIHVLLQTGKRIPAPPERVGRCHPRERRYQPFSNSRAT